MKWVLQSGHHNPKFPAKYLKRHWLPYVGFYGSYLHDVGAYNVSSGAVSDIGRAASPAKSKMAAMIAEPFAQLQLKIMHKLFQSGD